MPNKIVLRLDMKGCYKCKKIALHSVTQIEGIDSLTIDMKEGTLTVIGDADPVCLCNVMRKKFKCAQLISVSPPPPPPIPVPPPPTPKKCCKDDPPKCCPAWKEKCKCKPQPPCDGKCNPTPPPKGGAIDLMHCSPPKAACEGKCKAKCNPTPTTPMKPCEKRAVPPCEEKCKGKCNPPCSGCSCILVHCCPRRCACSCQPVDCYPPCCGCSTGSEILWPRYNNPRAPGEVWYVWDEERQGACVIM